jgi:hypothetical protein
MIGFIALYALTIRDYRQLQCYRWSTHFTVHRYTRTKVLSLHWSYPGNGFITVSMSVQFTHIFTQSDSFLAISSQSLYSAISRTRHNSRQQLSQMNLSSTEISQLLKTDSNNLLCHFITSRHGPRRKQPLYCSHGLFTDPLPSNGRPIGRVRFRGNVFAESLPSSGSICQYFLNNVIISNCAVKSKNVRMSRMQN